MAKKVKQKEWSSIRDTYRYGEVYSVGDYLIRLSLEQVNEWEEYYRNHDAYARWMKFGAARELLIAHATGGTRPTATDLTIMENLTQGLITIRQELFQVAKEWCAPIQRARKEHEESIEHEEADGKQQSNNTDNN